MEIYSDFGDSTLSAPDPGYNYNPDSEQLQGLIIHAPLWFSSFDGTKPKFFQEISSNLIGQLYDPGSISIVRDSDTGLYVPSFPNSGSGNSTHLIGLGGAGASFVYNSNARSHKNPPVLTAMAWYKPTGNPSTYCNIFGDLKLTASPIYCNWSVRHTPTGEALFSVGRPDGAAETSATSASSFFVNNEWNLIAGVADGATVKVYVFNSTRVKTVGGALGGTVTWANFIGNVTGNITIGGNTQQLFAVDCVPGAVMECRLYNEVKSYSQLEEMYFNRWGLYLEARKLSVKSGSVFLVEDADEVLLSTSASSTVVRPVSEETSVVLTTAATSNRVVSESIAESLSFSDVGRNQNVAVTCLESLVISDSASVARNLPVSCIDTITLSDTLEVRNTIIRVSAITQLSLSGPSDDVGEFIRSEYEAITIYGVATARTDKIDVFSSDAIIFSDDAARGGPISLSIPVQELRLQDDAIGGFAISASASDALVFDDDGVAALRQTEVLTFTDVVSVSVQNPRIASTVTFSDRATGKVTITSARPGMRNSLYGSMSGVYPNTYTQTPDGLLLIANGIDPVLKWDGKASQATTAGVKSPTTACVLSGDEVTTGGYTAYVRFVDEDGNFSDLSPISNQVAAGKYGYISGVTLSAGTVRITSTNHGLSAGNLISIDGIVGTPYANGYFAISLVTDANTFTITPSVDRQGNLSVFPISLTGSSNYQSGGTWTLDVAISYTSVPVPVESKVVRKQILRNTSQQSLTYYLDIDTTDINGTTFSSTKNDNDLIGSTAVPLFDDNGNDIANLYGIPPSGKTCIMSHLGRVFLAVDSVYDDGNVRVTSGSKTVVGIGTAWTSVMESRFLHVVGAARPYEIDSVNTLAQTLELTEAWGTRYGDISNDYAVYSIKPQAADRRTVYYSAASNPEGWPAFNGFTIQDDGDEITGLLLQGSYLYILENRHMYRFSYDRSPEKDGNAFLASGRGCVSQRCAIYVEGSSYLLDESGIHQFTGDQQSNPVSAPIQPFFQSGIDGLKINWSADRRYWHASHDPLRDTIRWFVSVGQEDRPRHAVCYNYRVERWWIEEYQIPITSSCVARLGALRSMVGSSARKVLVLAEGDLDGRVSSGTIRGSVTSCAAQSLTDSTASHLASDVLGLSVTIVSGRGANQTRRIISANGTRLGLDRPWLIRPDSTSTYQIGGILWQWQSGWYRYADSEFESDRTIEALWEPTDSETTMSMSLYYDHSRSPNPFTFNYSSDGVVITEDSDSAIFDLARSVGHGVLRMTGHKEYYATGVRYISVRLSGVSNQSPVRIYNIRVNGAETP